MRYLPHTPDDITAMLDAVGIETVDGLFANIPDDCRRKELAATMGRLSQWSREEEKAS